ncbi:hypothetical protein [Maricaulis sp. CAU 1757]
MTDYLLGYGSLLSRHSRETYSDVTSIALPVRVHGWRRGWTVRYADEAATYVGVRPDRARAIEAVLVETPLSPELRQRERGYAFSEIDPASIETLGASSSLPQGRFWMVVNSEHWRADADHPVVQSYVDTCLAGCLESGGEARVRAFIRQTEMWDGTWVNDRAETSPRYPRHTPLEKAEQALLDALLEDEGVLRYRRG